MKAPSITPYAQWAALKEAEDRDCVACNGHGYRIHFESDDDGEIYEAHTSCTNCYATGKYQPTISKYREAVLSDVASYSRWLAIPIFELAAHAIKQINEQGLEQ